MNMPPPLPPWTNPWPYQDPRSCLLEYQHHFWRAPARFKIALFARQTGKDFTAAGELVEDCFKPSSMAAAAPTG